MHFSLLLFLTVFVVLHRFGICQEYEIDDEHPDEENFCVLDEQGNPVNCRFAIGTKKKNRRFVALLVFLKKTNFLK